MPISLADPNEEYTIKRIGGSPEMKKHLKDLGFIVGDPIKIVSINHNNVIVKIKGSRVALGAELARRIFV